MAKIVLNPIVGSYASVVALNARFQQIEDAFNDNILWRGGFVAEPNSMSVDLDMAGNNLLNAVIDPSNDLNAATLDLLDSTQFLRSDQSDSTSGTLTATGGFVGNLIGDVTGPTFVINDNPPDTTMFPLIVGSNSVGFQDVSTDGSFKWDASTNTLNVPNTESDLIGSVGVPTNGLSINGTIVTATAQELNEAIHFTDGANPTIANVATRANQFLGFDALGEMIYSAGTTVVSASAVPIVDAGGHYAAVEVESALQEVVANQVNITGDTMTGELFMKEDITINGSFSNPTITFEPSNSGGQGSILFRDASLANRVSFRVVEGTALTELGLRDPAGILSGTVTFKLDGNIGVSAPLPLNPEELTRKDYVDRRTHAGRIATAGTVHTGTDAGTWTITIVGVGNYQLTHNLGHINYSIVASSASTGTNLARVVNTDIKTTNTVNIFVEIATTGVRVNEDVEYSLIEW